MTASTRRLGDPSVTQPVDGGRSAGGWNGKVTQAPPKPLCLSRKLARPPLSVPIQVDHVKLVLTLDLRRALPERLSAKAIREGKNVEAIVLEMLEAGAK
jgi:hypothetical protein